MFAGYFFSLQNLTRLLVGVKINVCGKISLLGEGFLMKTSIQAHVFYYHFKLNYVWLFSTLMFLGFIVGVLCRIPVLIYWWQVWGLIGVCIYSLVLWCIKYKIKHKMAVIDDKYIKIWDIETFTIVKEMKCKHEITAGCLIEGKEKGLLVGMGQGTYMLLDIKM